MNKMAMVFSIIFAVLFFSFDWVLGPSIGKNAESGRAFFMGIFAFGLLVSVWNTWPERK